MLLNLANINILAQEYINLQYWITSCFLNNEIHTKKFNLDYIAAKLSYYNQNASIGCRRGVGGCRKEYSHNSIYSLQYLCSLHFFKSVHVSHIGVRFMSGWLPTTSNIRFSDCIKRENSFQVQFNVSYWSFDSWGYPVLA